MPITINSLPNEVILNILLYLDYQGLKKCMRINKAFNAIIKCTAFDKQLFRSSRVIGKHEIIDRSTLSLHPVLIHKQPRAFAGNYGSILETDTSDEQATLPSVTYLSPSASKVLDEHTTAPPVGYLCIDLFSNSEHLAMYRVRIKNPQGVTIRQLCKEMRRIHDEHGISRFPTNPEDSYKIVLWGWNCNCLKNVEDELTPNDLVLAGGWNLNGVEIAARDLYRKAHCFRFSGRTQSQP
ncbi:hypothetical protein KCU78_g3727, partial [Aureobasidium melanogenum]